MPIRLGIKIQIKKKIKHSEVTTFQLLQKVVSDKTSDGGVFIPNIKNVTMTYQKEKYDL